MKPGKSPLILTSSACAAMFIACASAPSIHAATVIVSESFGAGALNGQTADTYNPAITSAGGGSTWVAASTFAANGVVTATDGNSGAYLNLGSYINSAKGMANGKFELTMTISTTTGSWISLGFTTQNAPNIGKNFTNIGAGADPTNGVATILRRSTTATPANEIDAFHLTPTTSTQTQLDGPDGLTGNRTLTIALDFTTLGGYNGTTNFGTARFFDIGNNPTTPFQTYTYTEDRSFGAIFISEADTTSGLESGGTISNLSLTQIPEPRAVLLGCLGLLALLRRRRF